MGVRRVVYTECPVTCPCGEKCSNQRIQRREWLSRSLEKFLTDDRGFGVRTTQAIAAGMTLQRFTDVSTNIIIALFTLLRAIAVQKKIKLNYMTYLDEYKLGFDYFRVYTVVFEALVM